MQFSASKIDITPATPKSLVGYGSAPRMSADVRRRLEVNALLIDSTCAIISADALYMGRDFISHVRTKLPDNLSTMFVASHTHFAPSLDGTKPALGLTDGDWLKQVASSVADQIIALAASSAVARRLSYGVEICFGSVYRRRRSFLRRKFPHLTWRIGLLPNRRKAIPRDLQILAIRDSNDKIGAVIWSWPCHPVEFVCAKEVSSAFPGAVRDAIRHSLGDATLPVLFFPGFCGDIRPDITKNYLGFEVFKRASGSEIATFEAGVVDTALRALRGAETIQTGETQYRETVVPLKSLGPVGDFDIGVTQVNFGDVEITGVGAEVCSGHLNQTNFDRSKPKFFTGCAGPTFGYLPTDEQIAEGGYESDEFMPFFSVSGNWKPNVTVAVAQSLGSHLDDQ